MLKDKLNMVFNFRSKNSTQFCKEYDLKQPNYAYKAKGNRFYLYEAIQIADFTNTKLAFINDKGEPIVMFDMEDIKDI